MYCEHFGFSEKPFDVTPDPNFLYLSPAHEEMLASIIYGIQERRGFITIVGEVGTGKTTLIHAALERLDRNTRVAYIFNTDITFNQLLQMALLDLGLAEADARISKVQALQRLNDFAIEQLSRGGNVALIIDEAQNLDRRTMENLRLLSNLETPKYKLVQIVLCGQPELDQKLTQAELRQLAQRISIRRQIHPLDEKQTHEYIRHRLSRVDYNGADLFSPEAQQLIWTYSGGVPRKINILCDNALLIGYGLRTEKIEAAAVEETIADLGWRPGSESETAGVSSTTYFEPVQLPTEKKSSFARTAWVLICLVFALTFGLWLFMGNGLEKLKEAKSAITQRFIMTQPTNFPDNTNNSSDNDKP